MIIKPTVEQQAALDTDENIKISALAGTGKTSLLHMYIKSRPNSCKVLYLAFNKSVQLEAEHRFKDVTHLKLDIKTAHSMAYYDIITPNKHIYKKIGDLSIEEILEACNVDNYILGVHIKKAIEIFCQSKLKNIDNLDYLSFISSPEAYGFADEFKPEIISHAKDVLAKMFKGELTITHDFYLKMYHLRKPKLNYDYILFDEAQDASELMLDIVLAQKGIKVIVGDSNQQIYSWRNAIDSLKKVNFPEYKLTTSWRFPTHIADLAKKAVSWKNVIGYDNDMDIIGHGISTETTTKAIIGRSNAKLVGEAIKKVLIENVYSKPYFEGGFDSYNFKNSLTLINDLLSIKNSNGINLKNAKLKGITNIKDLTDFIEKTEDTHLSFLLSLVKKYNYDLLGHINKLESLAVKTKYESDIVFSTVHCAKGMEYDQVTLLSDFINLGVLNKTLKDVNLDFKDKLLTVLNEEINLLYVAITRSKNQLFLSDSLLKDLK